MKSEMNAPASLITVEVETSAPPKRKISRKAQLTHVHRRKDKELIYQPSHGFSKQSIGNEHQLADRFGAGSLIVHLLVPLEPPPFS